MSYLSMIDISASGLTAERLRMDLIANNLANVNTTRTGAGGPYRRKVAVLQENPVGPGRGFGTGGGVRVAGVLDDATPGRLVYDPGHPDSAPNGYVEYPNVNVVTEMVDLITASRAYEANVTALNAAKEMVQKTLEIGRA